MFSILYHHLTAHSTIKTMSITTQNSFDKVLEKHFKKYIFNALLLNSIAVGNQKLQ